MYKPKYVIPPNEREFMNDLEEIAVQKLYDSKSQLNHRYSQIISNDEEIINHYEKQLEIIHDNQVRKVETWKQKYIDATIRIAEKEGELVEHQSEEAKHEINNRVIDYIQFRARLLMSQFPKQAEYFLKKGWKSPIHQPETERYPYRPEIEGEYDESGSLTVSFPNYGESQTDFQPKVDQVLKNIRIGNKAILHLPENAVLYGKIKYYDDKLIQFVAEQDNLVMNIPVERFANKDFYFELNR